MSGRISKLYKPAELVAVLKVLQQNSFHDFGADASAIVRALHAEGFKIVYVGKVGEND